MYKKLIYLISFVLVLGLVQASVAEGTDPNLVGWWKFDGNANDSSSQGNNGTTYGNPQWIAGYRDDALQFDGTDDYVSLPIGGVISTLSECTFATWVNWVGGADPNWQRIFDFGMTGNTGHYIYLCPKTGATSAAMRLALVTAYTSYWDEFDASTGALPTGWHHVAVTFSESDANTMTLYLDGNVVGSKTNCVNRISQLGNTNRNWLGRSVYTPDPYLNGTLDDFQIYNRVLSQPEIKKVANPEKASMPIPADGSIIGQLSVTLQWDAGVYAADVNGHEVYFGTNFTDVNTGTTPDFIVSDPCVVPGALEFDTEYFWRVDEVNLAEDPNVWRGDVWSFTVQPLTAYNPRPPDEAKYVDVNDDLVWDPGAKAKFHDVYLGTDETKVTDANRAIPLGVLVKQDHDANSYEPGTLQFSTTYYWRIDEVNATIWKGDVWSFETNPLILPPDPNLVGWWKFDDGEGTVAVDWSGNYNHATLYEPNWVTGYDGNALQFNGINDYVSLPVGEDINSLTSSTLATWVNFSGGGDWQNIFNFGTGTTNYIYLCPSTDAEVMYVGITTPETAEDAVSAPDALPSDWHHVAVTINADSNVMTLYLDAWPVGENIAATLTLSNLGVTTENWLGRSRWPNEPYFNGSMDDFRIYDYALTREEIALIMRVNPQLAWNPIPANGSTTDVVHAKRLSWSPGEMADKHDVYFGTDQTAVTDANRTNPLGILVSQNQDPNTYDPSNLEFGQTYYWRIDEVNMTEDPNIWKGKVWSFTTAADYIEIDNFNRYLTLDDLNDVWKDGYVKMDTGSHITVSTEIDSRYGHESPGPIHEGIDALQFVYDNNGFACRYVPDEWEDCGWRDYYYSEMEATTNALGVSDWTTEGVRSLSLSFYGDPCNSVIGDANQMYVAVEDGDTDVGIVKYGDEPAYENMSDLKKTVWQEWNIDLQRFVNDNASLDLNDVNKVYVGFGIRGNNTTPGGFGIVYFDSIRLYLQRCVSERVADDLSGDCDFNFDDFVTMADGWLCGAEGSPDSNLIGQWKFDGASGTTATDSIGGNHGTVLGGAVLDGSGQLILDGVDDYVSLPIGSVISTLDECSFAAWVDWPGTGGAWQRTFDFGHPNEPNLADPCEVTDPQKYTFSTPSPFRFVISLEGPDEPPEQIARGGMPEPDDPMPSGLHCIVATVDVNDVNENNVILSLYLDGRLVGRNTDANLIPSDLGNTPNNWLGRSLYAVDPYLIGSYDEFRIYNRVLSEVEVAQLYCSTLARPRADLNDDGVVDFKDMVMIIDKWLQGPTLWP